MESFGHYLCRQFAVYRHFVIIVVILGLHCINVSLQLACVAWLLFYISRGKNRKSRSSPLLGLSLLRNHTQTLITLASFQWSNKLSKTGEATK